VRVHTRLLKSRVQQAYSLIYAIPDYDAYSVTTIYSFSPCVVFV